MTSTSSVSAESVSSGSASTLTSFASEALSSELSASEPSAEKSSASSVISVFSSSTSAAESVNSSPWICRSSAAYTVSIGAVTLDVTMAIARSIASFLCFILYPIPFIFFFVSLICYYNVFTDFSQLTDGIVLSFFHFFAHTPTGSRICRSLLVYHDFLLLFKCCFRCVYRMICPIFDISVISRECTSCKIKDFVTGQTVYADSCSISGKYIIQIIRTGTIS